ncbi:hypothetical protein P280DRAFT_483419 [Massarina eburnea CBS 473.64]|uniref:Uncharacterized protein n=1 Tax=Massarina eburnea CBS 473.64 TaxID=1395130 RepID=A0A6A6RMC4_9PLEO|nr:hypothetical protein P280DRAFT_483419 [Massarina eburnea CBS 473.64]
MRLSLLTLVGLAALNGKLGIHARALPGDASSSNFIGMSMIEKRTPLKPPNLPPRPKRPTPPEPPVQQNPVESSTPLIYTTPPATPKPLTSPKPLGTPRPSL